MLINRQQPVRDLYDFSLNEMIDSANQVAGQSSKSSLGSEAANIATMKTGMNLDEAALILNIDKRKPLDMNEIKSKYDAIFKANDPSNGGSFYIQSKVYRAKERMDLELEKKE